MQYAQKIGKDYACGSGDILADKQTHTHTCSSQYFATAPANEVIKPYTGYFLPRVGVVTSKRPVAENKGLPDLVQFVTGAPYLPERLVVSFNTSSSHPISHACFNELELPTTHRQYDEFREAMIFALHHGMEFSRE